jgi:signal transduction histidine kinase
VARLSSAAYGLERLAHQMRSDAAPPQVTEMVSVALEDPSLRMLTLAPADGHAWVDENGEPADLPARASDVAVTRIGADGEPPTAVIHDPALEQVPDLVRAAAEIAMLRLDHDQVVERLRRSLVDLQQSRARLVEAADRERRAIERSLHDGAQQGLVVVRIRLSLLQARLEDVAPSEVGIVEALGGDVEAALTQIRALARDLYPPLLAAKGLEPALVAAVRSATVPVTVEIALPRRYPPDMETAVYFTCLEALQNASKHAQAQNVRLALGEADSSLWFEVRDDGVGLDPRMSEGSGLANIRDRISAVGGHLTIEGSPGDGTRIRGQVPVQPAGPAPGLVLAAQ